MIIIYNILNLTATNIYVVLFRYEKEISMPQYSLIGSSFDCKGRYFNWNNYS